jgi:hypothetical protein
MTTAATPRDHDEASKTPAEAFIRVTGAAIEYATHKVTQTAAQMTGNAAHGLHGGSPLWATIKLGWASAGPRVKAAIVAAVVAMVILLIASPVLLLAFLLSWLIIRTVEKVSSASG